MEARWDSACGASKQVPVSTNERLAASSAAALAAAFTKGRCLKYLCGVGAPAEAELIVICVCCGILWFLVWIVTYLPVGRQLNAEGRGVRHVCLRRQREKLTLFKGLYTLAKSQALGTAQQRQCTAFPLSYLLAELASLSCASTLKHRPQCFICVASDHADLLPLRPWIHSRQRLSTSAQCLALLSNLTAAQAAAALLKRIVSR